MRRRAHPGDARMKDFEKDSRRGAHGDPDDRRQNEPFQKADKQNGLFDDFISHGCFRGPKDNEKRRAGFLHKSEVTARFLTL